MAVSLESRASRGIRADEADVEGELPAVGRDRQRVVVSRADAASPDPLVAGDQASLDLPLLVRHRAGYDRGLAAFDRRNGQVQHVRRLHVGERAEHLLQLGQVHEPGEPRVRAQRRPVRTDFHGVRDLAEGGSPCVEVTDAALFQQRRGEIPLQRVHLDHRVADRRAGREHQTAAGRIPFKVAGLHQQIERAFRTLGLNAGDPVHFGRRGRDS